VTTCRVLLVVILSALMWTAVEVQAQNSADPAPMIVRVECQQLPASSYPPNCFADCCHGFRQVTSIQVPFAGITVPTSINSSGTIAGHFRETTLVGKTAYGGFVRTPDGKITTFFPGGGSLCGPTAGSILIFLLTRGSGVFSVDCLIERNLSKRSNDRSRQKPRPSFT
jgi:hypothetical protein